MSNETILAKLKLRLISMSCRAYRKLIGCEDAVCIDTKGASYWQGYNDSLDRVIKIVDEEAKDK